MNYIMVIIFSAGWGGGGITASLATEAACLQAAKHFAGIRVQYAGCIEAATGKVVDVK